MGQDPPERFLLHLEQEPLMYMFASDLDLELLANSQLWIRDGTFEMVPRPFKQLYTVHAVIRREPIPIVSALLSGMVTYSLFTLVKFIHIVIRNTYTSCLFQGKLKRYMNVSG